MTESDDLGLDKLSFSDNSHTQCFTYSGTDYTILAHIDVYTACVTSEEPKVAPILYSDISWTYIVYDNVDPSSPILYISEARDTRFK
jgi:hypothetical protein